MKTGGVNLSVSQTIYKIGEISKVSKVFLRLHFKTEAKLGDESINCLSDTLNLVQLGLGLDFDSSFVLCIFCTVVWFKLAVAVPHTCFHIRQMPFSQPVST